MASERPAFEDLFDDGALMDSHRLAPCVEMAIECHEFELGIGHVVDVDVGPMEHVPDFAECFGTSEEVQFFRDTDIDFLPHTDRRVAGVQL